MKLVAEKASWAETDFDLRLLDLTDFEGLEEGGENLYPLADPTSI